jgi:TonB-linked SusC/RagA family outer membrane protein
MKLYTNLSVCPRDNLYKFLFTLSIFLSSLYSTTVIGNTNKIPSKIWFTYSISVFPKSLDKFIINTDENDRLRLAKSSKKGGIKQTSSYYASSYNRLLSFFTSTTLNQDSIRIKGKIVDENRKPMPGVNVKMKNTLRNFPTNEQGEFSIVVPNGRTTIQITYIGYMSQELVITESSLKNLNIQLVPNVGLLSEVQVVTNGYQDLAKERATGSFEVVTATQLEHSNSPNLLRRLEGITTAINFNNNSVFKPTIAGTQLSVTNRNRSPLADITIRGKNTLSFSTAPFNNSGFPLLVIDGIASAYSIDQLDPENIETITILKDAASASIWGSRAANGVIVIKTKRGNYSQPPQITFNTNFNITEKPDLFYKAKMTVADFIDAERERFIREQTVLSNPTPLSSQTVRGDVVEIMNDYLNRKVISREEAEAMITVLKSHDVRQDISKYVLRQAVNQNYSFAVSGGAKKSTYFLSANYNKYLNNTYNSDADRLSLQYNGSLKLLPALDISWQANYSKQHTDNQNSNTSVGTSYTQFKPYDRLADDYGNPIQLFKYRPAFVNALRSTYGSNILDMTYKPLEERELGYFNSKIQGINLAVNINYKIISSLALNVAYSYNRQLTDEVEFISRNSYYIRELTNRFTNVSDFSRNLPYGDFFSPNRVQYTGQTFRSQLNYNKSWSQKHDVNAIAGVDISENYSYQNQNSFVGYDGERLTFSTNINPSATYPFLYDILGGVPSGQIPFAVNIFENRIRSFSTYANASYTYNKKYTISGSVRKDGSNLFGVLENKTGTPFYSTGLSWNILKENFIANDIFSRLQFRITYGYNGNSNPAAFPRPRITYSTTGGVNGLLFASVPLTTDATNNELRPEKTGVFNLGLDFGIFKDRISGSLEFYQKRTKDLIASNLIDPSTGFSTLSYNTGNLKAYGSDIIINSKNYARGEFSWNSNFLYSFNRVKVSALYIPGGVTANAVVAGTGTGTYAVGYDLSRLFAFRWAGLDPQNGNPRVYLNSQVLVINDGATGTVNYNAVRNAPASTAKYIGSTVPLHFGSFRNTFNYNKFSLSFNILYKLNYFTRRPLVDLANYSALYGENATLIGAEYAQRWRNPGDELSTNVPSLTYPGNSLKDYIYQYSDINVIQADHIRLQEINLGYQTQKAWLGLQNVRIFLNIANLGIIWRANKLNVDPDINDVPNPRTYGFGLSAKL